MSPIFWAQTSADFILQRDFARRGFARLYRVTRIDVLMASTFDGAMSRW